MKLSHVHCRVRDLPAAAFWFEKVFQVSPVFNNDRMVWLSFGELGVILDAATLASTYCSSAAAQASSRTGRLSGVCS